MEKNNFFLITGVLVILFSQNLSGAEQDTLWVIDASRSSQEEILSRWKHILPKKHRAYTNYSVEIDSKGPYLRALSSSTSSWLELEMGNIDITQYNTMAWMWMVNEFPKTTWEMNPPDDDFAIRIELVYDFKGGKKNILNIIRKGIITTIFKRYPPELIVSYVWSLNVPAEKPYQSPHSNRMMILPIESDVVMQGRWIHETRNIKEDLYTFKGEKNPLYLKKIRICSDTENKPTVAESGIKYIYLLAEKETNSR